MRKFILILVLLSSGCQTVAVVIEPKDLKTPPNVRVEFRAG